MTRNFKTYKVKSEMKVVGREIHSVEYAFGCDGDNHALNVCRLYMDGRGKTYNGEHIGDVELGECDGSCCIPPNLGGFLMDE